jgi:hypothetical protein
MPMSIEQLAARQTSLSKKQKPRQPHSKRSKPAGDAGIPRHYTKLKIVSNGQGQSILFGWDSDNYLFTIWLPGTTPGEWIIYEPEFGGSPYIEDFDLISNHLQGRQDDTIDLVIMAYGKDESGLYLYFPALPFSTRLEDWQAYFSKPIDLTPFRPGYAYQVRLGLLPKARRSVFICDRDDPVRVTAVRCDVDWNGQVVAYPFHFGPEWNPKHLAEVPIFEPCVLTRKPGSFDLEDGLVGSFVPIDGQGDGVVKVMLPKTPQGEYWELTPSSPLMAIAKWRPVSGIRTFLQRETGEPIIVFTVHSDKDSPLNKAVWVMDFHTLYNSREGSWWLAAPPDQVFPPPGWSAVQALPVRTQDGQPPFWVWLQLGERAGTEQPYALIESRSKEFFDEDAPCRWLLPANYFDASLAASSEIFEGTTARVFQALDSSKLPFATQSLSVARLDNTSGHWQYENVPVPPPPPDSRR